jgi:fermentation-respiration switch protein FrsA (DUF1100 family)
MYNVGGIFLCRSASEAGHTDYTPGAIPSLELYRKLYRMSPIAHIHNVVTPTLIYLGEDDRRVPPFVGQEFYRALKLRGVTCRYAFMSSTTITGCSNDPGWAVGVTYKNKANTQIVTIFLNF